MSKATARFRWREGNKRFSKSIDIDVDEHGRAILPLEATEEIPPGRTVTVDVYAAGPPVVAGEFKISIKPTT